MSDECACVGVGTCEHGNEHAADDVTILYAAQITPTYIKTFSDFKRKFPPINAWICSACEAKNPAGQATCHNCLRTPLSNFRGNQ